MQARPSFEAHLEHGCLPSHCGMFFVSLPSTRIGSDNGKVRPWLASSGIRYKHLGSSAQTVAVSWRYFAPPSFPDRSPNDRYQILLIDLRIITVGSQRSSQEHWPETGTWADGCLEESVVTRARGFSSLGKWRMRRTKSTWVLRVPK